MLGAGSPIVPRVTDAILNVQVCEKKPRSILTYASRNACNAPRGVEDRPLLDVGLEVLKMDPAGAAGIVNVKADRGVQAAADSGLEDSQVDRRVGRDAAVQLHLGHDRTRPVGILRDC